MSCITPIILRNEGFAVNPSKQFSHNRIPCGKCITCLQKKSREWIFRLKQELKVSSAAHFITLTYSDDYLIYTNEGTPTLYKKDFQNFIKKLRKAQDQNSPGEGVRYFACGEYGSRLGRPHYHAIAFNTYPNLIEDSWANGICHIGTVTEDSIAYTTKYILKANQDYETQFKEQPDFQRSFALMSKGIGKSYLKKEVVKYHKNNLDQPYIQDERGFKILMPRYYASKIFTEDELKIVKQSLSKFHKEQSAEKEKQIREDEANGKNPYLDEVRKNEYKIHIFDKRIKQKNDKL